MNDHDTYPIQEPRSVSAARGAGWLVEGFGYFRKAPKQWLLLSLVGFMIMIGLSLVPIVNLVSGILGPVWTAGILLGCKALHEGKPLEIQHLFAGFGDKLGQLVLSGLLIACLSMAIVVLVLGPTLLPLMMNADADPSAIPGWPSLLWRILLIFVLMLPIYAASWFAPALIALGNIGVMDAVKVSLRAGVRNIGPMLVFSLASFILMIPVMLTLGLGMLVAGPMIFSAFFISFREIFVEE